MCIACRSRHPQHTLIRLKLEGKEIIAYNGYGRSIYLCNTCSQNNKKLKGLVKRFRLDEERFIKLLTETRPKVGECEPSQPNEGANQ